MSRRRFIKHAAAFFALLTGGDRRISSAEARCRRQSRFPAVTEPAAKETVLPEPAEALSQEPPLSFFLLSDLHISVGESSMTDKLHSALKDITDFESKVDAIVLGGDLTDFGRESDYRSLQRVLDQYKLPPTYGNMGNHDYYDIWLNEKGAFSTETVPNGKTDAMSRERFQKFIGYEGRPYHDEWMQGVHLIMLSQESYVEERPEVGEGAWYSDEQTRLVRIRDEIA
ncbi:metallophosphoesterase [Paenibacillus sp. P26]|nr:metallophosphoesterase [Paenibacillus sp. P26]